MRPILAWAGFILTAATAVALMWFALWAPGLEWPRVPARQHPGEHYGFSLARGVGCDTITINSLAVSERKLRVDECAQHEGQLRFDQENLNQAVRTTNAAEEAIRVSYQQTRIAYVQSAVTVLALLFTGVAAWAAARAARTANRALSHAEAASRDELRAYVHIDRAELKWGSPRGGAPSITLFAKNTGQTPAKWFGAQTAVVVGPIEGDNPLPLADLHHTGRKLHRWSALGGGTELSFGGTSAYVAELQRALTEQLTINVLGVVQYETIFGELCESEFWFVRRPEHKFRAKRPDNAASGVAIYGTGEEIPASMQRAAVALRTYRRLTSFEFLKTDEGS